MGGVAVRQAPADKYDARRNQLAESALRTLGELGYARTSLREIASNSEFSHGVVHYYFDDKFELIIYCVRYYKARCVTRYDAVIAESVTPGGLVEAFAAKLAETIRDEAPMHRLWYDLRTQSMFEQTLREAVTMIDKTLEEMIWRVVSRYASCPAGAGPLAAGRVRVAGRGVPAGAARLHHRQAGRAGRPHRPGPGAHAVPAGAVAPADRGGRRAPRGGRGQPALAVLSVGGGSAPVMMPTTSFMVWSCRADDRGPPAEPVDVDAVGDLEHGRDVVADQHHRHPVPRDPLDQVQHALGLATPSAAVGSSMMTTLRPKPPPGPPRPSAAGRRTGCPTGWVIDCSVVMPSSSICARGLLAHLLGCPASAAPSPAGPCA